MSMLAWKGGCLGVEVGVVRWEVGSQCDLRELWGEGTEGECVSERVAPGRPQEAIRGRRCGRAGRRARASPAPCFDLQRSEAAGLRRNPSSDGARCRDTRYLQKSMTKVSQLKIFSAIFIRQKFSGHLSTVRHTLL